MQDDDKIWRYLDFTKFVSLLDSESIFMTRLDLMSDPFEGSYPAKFFQTTNIPSLLKTENQRIKLRKHMVINCWHKNDYESAAMWSLYLKSDEGVVIQSTVSSLVHEVFSNTPLGYSPIVAPIRYIDFERDNPPLGYLGASSLKRKSFEHEKEIRALLYKCNANQEIDNVDPIESNGISLHVDINNLIKSVYVSPTSPAWFYDLVKSITEKYGLLCNIYQSSLKNESPIF